MDQPRVAEADYGVINQRELIALGAGICIRPLVSPQEVSDKPYGYV